MKNSRLYLFTFIGILLSLVLAGALAAPIIMNYVRKTYVTLQIDVNMRQADNMARILRNLLDQGESPEMVIDNLQASVEGSEVDRGYLCMIDKGDGQLLCHPDPGMIGQSIAPMGQTFSDLLTPSTGEKPWIDSIQGGAGTGGLLVYPDGTVEIDYFTPVPGTDWILSSHENTKRIEGEIALIQYTLLAGFGILGLLIAFPASWAARRVSRRYERTIEKEQARSENLLLNVLPAPIAARLKDDETAIADSYDQVTVLFADIVGFTKLTRNSDPAKVLKLLNSLFSTFDEMAKSYGMEKIKTIGDAWMAASGLPVAESHNPGAVAELALDMQDHMKRTYLDKNKPFYIRIGIHTGPAAAGVVGISKFAYDLWGETVNLASRLESTCEKGKIHVSETFRKASGRDFNYEERGEIELKGLGAHRTWYLTGRS